MMMKRGTIEIDNNGTLRWRDENVAWLDIVVLNACPVDTDEVRHESMPVVK
jgi:hypothetical protein